MTTGPTAATGVPAARATAGAAPAHGGRGRWDSGAVRSPTSGRAGLPTLVGRDEELRAARDLLLRGSGRILWTGDAAAGKTSLLDHAASRAADEGADVVRCSAGGVPGGLRRDVHARRVVVVADDLDRLPASVRAELVEATSGSAGAVVLLATATRPPQDCGGLEVRPLAPISPSDALAVLRDRGGPVVAPHVLAELLRETGGCPGALLETVRLLSDEQCRGWVAVPDPAPVAGAVRRHVHSVLDGAGAFDRTILLTAGVAVTRRTDVLLRALGIDVQGLLDSRAAEHIDLVAGHATVRDRRVRAVVHDEASLRDRTRAHRSLAEAAEALGEPAAALWHRALAELEGDPALVAPLRSVASALLDRGEADWAARVAREALAHARAAERPAALALLGRAALRANLLVEARDALEEAVRGAGTPEGTAPPDLLMTLTRLSGMVPSDPAGTSSAVVRLAAAGLHAGHGRPRAARDALPPLAAVAASPALADAHALVRATVAIAEGDPGPAIAARAHVTAEPVLADMATALGALGLSLAGRVGEARAALATQVADARSARSRDAWSGLTLDPCPTEPGWGGGQAFVRSCTTLSEVLVELHAGDLARARAVLTEAVLAAPPDQCADGLAAVLSGRLAVMCDARTDGVADTLADLLAEPVPPRIRTELARTRALGSFLRGETRRAVSVLGLVGDRPDGTAWACLPTFGRAELAALGGYRVPRGAHSTGVPGAGEHEDVAACAGPIGALRSARAALAWQAASDDAPRLVAEALAALRDVDNPFEAAQTHLLVGHVLRRLGRGDDGDAHLVSAVELFEGSGARAAADMARTHLRREVRAPRMSGGSAGSRRLTTAPGPAQVAGWNPAAAPSERPARPTPGPSWTEPLTPREVEVARAVATGLSNRRVATTLSLSVRTVEVHLTSIFRKLGTSSRTELALLVTRQDD